MAWGGESGEAVRQNVAIKLSKFRMVQYPINRDQTAALAELSEVATLIQHPEKGPRIRELISSIQAHAAAISEETDLIAAQLNR